MESTRLLLVEDDITLARGMSKALQQCAYSVEHVANGEEAAARLEQETYDGVLLDLCLPGEDGMTILKELRARGDATPVLVITARDTLDDRVRGLDSGADDYLTKPFALRELEARVRAILRRGRGGDLSEIKIGRLRYDREGRRLFIDERAVELSSRETEVLEVLLINAGRVVSKETLLEAIAREEKEVGQNAIEVYVHRIRKKLEEGDIELRTIRGLGYIIEIDE